MTPQDVPHLNVKEGGSIEPDFLFTMSLGSNACRRNRRSG